jgi:hypothetical protein
VPNTKQVAIWSKLYFSKNLVEIKYHKIAKSKNNKLKATQKILPMPENYFSNKVWGNLL